jgi:hypothetical protein
MKTIFIIIGIVFSLTIYYFVCQHRIRKTRKFQEEMQPGNNCVVDCNGKRHRGTLKSSRNPQGEDMGLGKIWVTVSFSDTDCPVDEKGHRIIAKNYLRQDIYPV